MISDLYKTDLTRRSERTTRGRPRASNIPAVTEIGGEIDHGTIFCRSTWTHSMLIFGWWCSIPITEVTGKLDSVPIWYLK